MTVVTAGRGKGHKKCPKCGRWGRRAVYPLNKKLAWRLETFTHVWEEDLDGLPGVAIVRPLESCSIKIDLCRVDGCKLDKEHGGEHVV